MSTPRLSVLDQTPVGEDHTPDEALRASVDLARAAEDLGYTRYWAAEHHGSPGFASSAPEILAGALLAHTSHMRIGTGGVLLPRYDPAKIAEVFGVLGSLHPGRVDLGIGRAGGPARDFPQRLADLRTLLGPTASSRTPRSRPRCGSWARDAHRLASPAGWAPSSRSATSSPRPAARRRSRTTGPRTRPPPAAGRAGPWPYAW
uniref:MsnO8 family LLM class oxidoreductase n=1 Tax=Streptomyces sp. NBC_00049 TaxID=2903617 RepID=A0AAU2JJG4_9ACTN